MIENPVLLVWQGCLIAIVSSIFAAAAWFLVWSFLRGNAQRRSTLAVIFIGIGVIATYECWLEGDRFLSQHYDPGDIPGWVGWISCPGMVADLLIFNRTDIPENDPDLWQTAWLVAPSSAMIWTAFLVGGWKGVRYVHSRFSVPHGASPHS